MVEDFLKSENAPIPPRSWCLEWFGSQGDFIAGRAAEPISLERFAGLESLYAVGPLAQARGEISIFDSTPLISEVRDDQANIAVDFDRRAAFLVYAIVGVVITSSITVEAAKYLKLKKGDDAYAIIKAAEVIVGKE